MNARLSALVLVIARLCLAGLGIVVLYGVVMRYAFNDAPPYVADGKPRPINKGGGDHGATSAAPRRGASGRRWRGRDSR